jgi:hypothetical protein
VPVESERVVGRCENCGAALARGSEADLDAEWRAVIAGGEGAIAVPNRASLQAAIGTEGWAAFDQAPGALMLTARSLELLAERNGYTLDAVGTPVSGRAHAWMWQTLINGLTFHPNFAREVRAGRLRMANARNRFAFIADCVATVLAAPLVALVSVPAELIAAVIGRGGELRARAHRSG